MQKLWLRLLAALAACAVLFALCLCLFAQDKQVLAARHHAARTTGVAWLDTAEGQKKAKDGALQMEALTALQRNIRPGELVFSDSEFMAVRYAAHCPMAPGFKDGNIINYAKEPAIARRWVEMQRVMASSPQGWIAVWKDGEAPLLLTRRVDCRDELLRIGDLLFENSSYLLLRRR